MVDARDADGASRAKEVDAASEADTASKANGTKDPVARSAPDHATGVVLVAMSVALWWPAFTLGAWGTLFFDQLLTVWAAATAAFVVVALQPHGFRRRVFRLVVLLIPSLWLVLSFVPASATHDRFAQFVDILAVLIALLGIPFTLWTLVRILWPDLGSGLSRVRVLIAIVALIAVVVISFELGAHQADFLTCHDFEISGNSNPPGCVR